MTWFLFCLLICLLLAFDLLVLNKKKGAVNHQKTTIETLFWVSIALSFSLVIYCLYREGLVAGASEISPKEAFITYLTGYLIELSLSVDNLFVIAMIFTAFGIPMKYQHKALFWGILGAIVFRGFMIGFGVVLIQKFGWLTYVFGAFLLYTAVRMMGQEDRQQEMNIPQKIGKYFRISKRQEGESFWILEQGKRVATPLFAALIMIELTDLLFALDSIPAILAITSDPFLVFSSNIFAILGLRSMYFFLANMMESFSYLKYSVCAILIFVGVKMISMHFVHFPEWASLLFISLALITGILVSLIKRSKTTNWKHAASK